MRQMQMRTCKTDQVCSNISKLAAFKELTKERAICLEKPVLHATEYRKTYKSRSVHDAQIN